MIICSIYKSGECAIPICEVGNTCFWYPISTPSPDPVQVGRYIARFSVNIWSIFSLAIFFSFYNTSHLKPLKKEDTRYVRLVLPTSGISTPSLDPVLVGMFSVNIWRIFSSNNFSSPKKQLLSKHESRQIGRQVGIQLIFRKSCDDQARI